MSNPKHIYYEKTKEPNIVVLHIPVHYPGPYEQEDEHDPKKRLAVLKRAQHRIKKEIKAAERRIENDEIKNSNQISIEQVIEEEIKHVRNKNGYE